MPELPDILVYVDALKRTVEGRPLRRVLVRSPFLVRTFEPPIDAAIGKRIEAIERLGKRIVWRMEGDVYVVLHLMIAGRLRWDDDPEAKPVSRIGLATFGFDHGTLQLTEASPKKRASLHVLRGRESLAALDRGGLDVLACTAAEFVDRLRLRNHTLKRALRDPTLFDGIGNAYGDEVLHAARLSPVTLTRKLGDAEALRLFEATRSTLAQWIDRLRGEFADRFPRPGDVTAFRPDFAVHGRFGQACPICGTKVQRIVYAENETNYCPVCQAGGKVLADRSLSRLLRDDWPRTVDELEG